MAEEVAALSIRLEANINKLERSVQRAQRTLNRGARNMERRTDRLDRRLARMGNRFGASLVSQAAISVAAIATIRKAIKDVVSSGDNLRSLEGRFKALTGSAERAGTLIGAAFDIVGETGGSFDAAVGGLTRFTIAAEAIGATDEEVTQLTQNLLKLGAIGGGSAQEVRSGIIQLGQSLSKGRADGDELRSVMENLPLVAKVIAKEFGVAVGQLKKLGEQGELTSERIFSAIINTTADVDQQFAALPQTVERAANKMAASWVKFTAALDNTLGISQQIQTVFESISGELEVQARQIENAPYTEAQQGIIDTQNEIKRLTEEFEAAKSAEQDIIDTAAELKRPDLAEGAIESIAALTKQFEAAVAVQNRLLEGFRKTANAIKLSRLNVENPRSPTEGPAGFIAEQERNTPVPPRRPGSTGSPIDLRNEPDFGTPPKRRGGSASAPDEKAAIELLRAMTERIELLRLEAEQIGATSEEIVRGNAALDKKRALEELDRLAAEENTVVTQGQIDQAKAHIDTIERLTIANAQLEASEDERLRKEENLKRTIDDVARSIEQAVFNAETFEDALKNLAIVLARTALNAALQGSGGSSGGGGTAGIFASILSGVVSGAAGGGGVAASAKGNAFSGGNIIPFARGGIVGGPTVFPMAKGIGLMGEAGPEAVLPLKRGPGGRLGVEGGGQGTTIFIDATGADEAALARVEASLREMVGPGIVERRAVSAILNERRRNPKLFGPSGAR